MVTISETIAPGIVMANARLCYMDNGESKVNRDTMNDHCGLGGCGALRQHGRSRQT
jgi:hypothetical protein